jgi:hypothetical protein
MAALNFTPASAQALFPIRTTPANAAFFYVEGIPTKGTWIDLDDVEGWTDIDDALSAAGYDAQGGDILTADVEGPLASCCYSSRSDCFDMDQFIELRDTVQERDAGAVAVFVAWYGAWDADAFENAYMGQYETKRHSPSS